MLNFTSRVRGMDEKRLKAQQRLEYYKARLATGFNKMQLQIFQVGDLILEVRRLIILNKCISDKFTSKWNGSYVVKKVYSSSAYKIDNQDGIGAGPIKGKFLKQCFP